MAMHKLNKFHWHLVDGIGWRIQIDKYPLLTERGAWRVTIPENMPWKQYTTCFKNETDDCYGGFYTKDDIKEIVKYASQRFIDIIPEIEMPGHSHAALECYPELICNGLPNKGVYCAGKEESFIFLENVLKEVMELFPYKYIHVGGDEVNKNNWEKCKLCQERMDKEGIETMEGLQGYFMNRIEKFLHDHGKTMIGWDEVMEGGVSSRAVIMSWRGIEGGIEAANRGQYAIMTPQNPCYFDFKQGNNENEPDAYHGFNNLTKVYDYDPIPQGASDNLKKYILGVQANLWTEKIPTLKHVEYMLLPRLSALSEVAWTMPANKNFKDFVKRLDLQFDRFMESGYNFSWSSVTPEAKVIYDANKKAFILEIYNETGLYTIRYRLDGKKPDITDSVFNGKITFSAPIKLYAQCFRKGKPVGYPLIKQFNTGFKDKWTIKYKYPYNDAYNGGGERALCDSRRAEKRGDDLRWQAIAKNDLDITIDLGEINEISEVAINFFQYRGVSAATFPERVIVLISKDGLNYEKVFEKNYNDIDYNEPLTRLVKSEFKKRQVRYIHLIAKNRGEVPDTNNTAWLFFDEIDVK